MKITTPHVILRDWSYDDTESLVRHADNPRIAAMMRDAFPYPYTQKDAQRFITMATGPAPDLFLAIDINGEAVGGVGIHLLDDVKHRTAEIGYWISESLWGKGIMSEAIGLLVPEAFKQYAIVPAPGRIFSNNPASMRVMEKCGFSREAVHRNAIIKNGIILDEVMYVLFRGI